MPDKKVATQASDGPWERETIITFNDAEKKASYYTCNKARVNECTSNILLVSAFLAA